ncbi:hypothetical protein JXB22_07705 [candidate division WOR-3 bacterium]|nr:hypothetical protein [candidate division WOR-3 bacterium]
MNEYIIRMHIRFCLAVVLFIIFLQGGCPQTPPDDVEEMVITRYMTRVVYHYGSIKPLLVAVMDEGTRVKAHPTSDGWYKIWWFEKGKWKTGYVPDSCLMRVPDTIDHSPE